MDACATKFLESATLRTLHAHNFTRSSTIATHVLTDLLARYFTLLATTSSEYADHANRTEPSMWDAVGALDELGVSLEDLTDFYDTEGRDLGRYAIQTSRRAEELAELKGQSKYSRLRGTILIIMANSVACLRLPLSAQTGSCYISVGTRSHTTPTANHRR